MSRKWIWEDENWADFQYDEEKLQDYIAQFDYNNALTLRDVISFDNNENDDFVVYIQGMEAFLSSKIEGEKTDLPELVGSIRANFNILSRVNEHDPESVNTPRRKSIARMMVDLYKTFDQPLSEDMLNNWNSLITFGESYSGEYRTYTDDMQIVSLDSLYNNRSSEKDIEYVAPPSRVVPEQMEKFIKWYNNTSPANNTDGKPMHAMIRAALAHLYFVAIHPYDDGNGRMARAIAVKAISENNGEPTLISLSHAIKDTKQEYYEALQQATRHNNVHAWVEYFCKTAVKAQELTKEKLYRAAIARTIEQKNDLTPTQKKGIEKVAHGYTKKPGIINASEYIEGDKPSMRERARQEERGLMAIAMADLEDMASKGILVQSKDNPKNFRLPYPHPNELLHPSGIEKIEEQRKHRPKKPSATPV